MTDEGMDVARDRRDELRREVEILRVKRDVAIDQEWKKLYSLAISHRNIEIRYIDSIIGGRHIEFPRQLRVEP